MTGYDWPRIHAMLNDLPSALLVAAVFFDLVGTFARRPALRQAGLATLILGAIGGVVAVLSGLQAEDSIAHGGAVHEVMERHEQFAFITLGVFGVLAVWRIFRESRMGNTERMLSTVAALIGLGALLTTGRLGGKLMFDHAAGIPSEVLRGELQQRGTGHEHGAGESHSHEAADAHDDDDHDDDAHGNAGHPAVSPAPGDSAQPARSATPTGHVDPPGTAPHTHEPAPAGHPHPAGTPPHKD